MNLEDFRACQRQGEGVSIEFKRCGNVPGPDTYETICAFANRQGGNIFLGVLDDGTVQGVDARRVVAVRRSVANAVNNPELFNVPPLLEMDELEVDGKVIVSIWVPAGSVVHRFKGVAYDRVADADVRLETDLQLHNLYSRKQMGYSERKVYPYLEKGDLRLDLLPRVRDMARARRGDHPWTRMDDDALLKSANLYLKDYETGAEGFTLAAALLLGKDEVIASVAPAYKTDAYVQVENKDRYDDRVVIKTNLIEAHDELLAFVQKHLPDRFFLDGAQTISLRDLIARELISNTLRHREYSSPLPAKLVIDGQGLRTENASRPRYLGRLTPEAFNPLPKNPIIAEFFANVGLADVLGSGTRNLFKYSWAYGGGQPVLVEGDVFKATVPLGSVGRVKGVADVDAVIERMLVDYGSVSVGTVADVAGVTERTVRRHIAPLIKDGKLVAVGSTRNRRYVAGPNR